MKPRLFCTLEVCLVALIFLPSIAAADSINLAWNPSQSTVAGYKLYVGTQSGTYSQDIDVGNVTTFTYSSAVAGQRYCFALSAYTSTSIESPKSNEVCGFSNTPPILTNPGNQSSTVGQPTTLQLTGSDPEGLPLTYSATGLPPGLTMMASTGFISGQGTTAGSYGVRVTASDGLLSSSQSFNWSMTSTTQPPPPPPPSTVTLSAEKVDRNFRDQIRLSWTTAAWQETWVYRNGTRIAQTANDGAFTDNMRQASGTFTYMVCAPDAVTCSNNVTVTF